MVKKIPEVYWAVKFVAIKPSNGWTVVVPQLEYIIEEKAAKGSQEPLSG